MTTTALRRLILDALAAGDTYDGFRTALRQKLKEIEADQ